MKSYPNHTEPELINLLSRDDKSAFESIYEKYAGVLFRYVYSRIRIREDSEELIQELFVWLWVNRQKISHVTALKPYLFNALRHKMVNYFERSAVRRKYAEHHALFEAGHQNATEEQSNVSDLKLLIEKNTASLPEKCKTAFLLSRIENMPISTIAEQMNVSTRTVENYITFATRHLKLVWRNI